MLLLLLSGLPLSCAQPTQPKTAHGFKSDAIHLNQPVLGINEAVSVPRALVRNNRLTETEVLAQLRKEASLTMQLGAKTVRANSHTYPYLNYMDAQTWSWTAHADRYVQTIQAFDLEPVMVIGPWPGIQTALYTQNYLPKDMTAYANWVEAVVERYDGDGFEDMPDLKYPILYWEVDNEPDLHNHRPPRGKPNSIDPSTFETPAEYAQLLTTTSAAIRKANPKAKVLFGGLASVQNAHGQAYLKQVLSQVDPNVFDILSVHCYIDKPTINGLERSMIFVRSILPDTPVWLTETGLPSDERKAWMTENKQGEMLYEIIASSLLIGFERVYWHTLKTPEKIHGPFASHGLLRSRNDNYAEKPSGLVYKALSDILYPAQWIQENSAGFSSDLGYFSSQADENGQPLVPMSLNLPYWHPSLQSDK